MYVWRQLWKGQDRMRSARSAGSRSCGVGDSPSRRTGPTARRAACGTGGRGRRGGGHARDAERRRDRSRDDV